MTIEERFERLEKQNRVLKKWLAGVGALAVAGLVAGTAQFTIAYTAAIEPSKVTTQLITATKIEAQQILVKDSTGNTRLLLNGADGSIYLGSASGKWRASISSCGQIAAYDTDGNPRVWINGTAGTIALTHSGGQNRVFLNSVGTVVVSDANAKIRAALASDGSIRAYDSGGKERVRLDGNTGNVNLMSASGALVLSLPAK